MEANPSIAATAEALLSTSITEEILKTELSQVQTFFLPLLSDALDSWWRRQWTGTCAIAGLHVLSTSLTPAPHLANQGGDDASPFSTSPGLDCSTGPVRLLQACPTAHVLRLLRGTGPETWEPPAWAGSHRALTVSDVPAKAHQLSQVVSHGPELRQASCTCRAIACMQWSLLEHTLRSFLGSLEPEKIQEVNCTLTSIGTFITNARNGEVSASDLQSLIEVDQFENDFEQLSHLGHRF